MNKDEIKAFIELKELQKEEGLRSYAIRECKACGEQHYIYWCEVHGNNWCKNCIKQAKRVGHYGQRFINNCGDNDGCVMQPMFKNGQ